jgi:D-3-phosphoglycerate dehydrogenase
MNQVDKVAVCSRSFSLNKILRTELLSKYKNVTFNDSGVSLSGDSLISFLSGHSMAITALEIIDDHVLSSLPDLKVIGKYGVGLDMIDLKSMKKHNKYLGWKSGVNKRSVSELSLLLALSIVHKAFEANNEVLLNNWHQVKGSQLSEKIFGIIGCGNVGKDLIKLLQPFNCKILVHDIESYDSFYDQYSIEAVSLDYLISTSDIISLHIPSNEETKNIISSEKIFSMKKGSFLINTARGGLVDEDALENALIKKHLAGAAFDVFSQEPPTNMSLIQLPNFIATPHIGGSTEEAILMMGRAAIDGLESTYIPE